MRQAPRPTALAPEPTVDLQIGFNAMTLVGYWHSDRLGGADTPRRTMALRGELISQIVAMFPAEVLSGPDSIGALNCLRFSLADSPACLPAEARLNKINHHSCCRGIEASRAFRCDIF